jgi:hypothetical protein
MKTAILIPTRVRRHVFESAKVLKQVGLTVIVFSVVMLAVDSANSQFVLTSVPGLPTLFGGSVAWGDYDNDGRLDFLLSGTDGPTSRPTLLLWRNTGNGFSNVTASVAPGLPGILDGSVAWGDFDNDGRLDFLIAGLTNVSLGVPICQIFRNTGSEFTNVPIPRLPGVAESSMAWSDFDGDGRLDFLITGTTVSNSGSPARLAQVSPCWRQR